MRLVPVMLSAAALAGCAIASIDRSARQEVAVSTASVERRILWPTVIRVRAQQVFVPSKADGQEEFCSTSPTFYSSGGARPQVMCFRDPEGTGRFTRAYGVYDKRQGGGIEVDIPYTVHPFPCSPCSASRADLTYVSDPQVLAEQSIAPAEYRPYVQLALANSADLNDRLKRDYPNDPAAAKGIIDLAAREVRDRRAAAICSAQNPGGAAAIFGIIGSLAAIAGGASEIECIAEYTRTGIMPIPPAKLEDAGAGGRAY